MKEVRPLGSVDFRPRTSVALCTLNGERFIADQLRSILGQTLLPDEIVVADDGSTDRTLDRVADVLTGRGVDWRVILSSGGPIGVVRNFQRAVANCRGDIVLLCDQDDLWHRTRVARAVEAFKADPTRLLVACDARVIDSFGVEIVPSMIAGMGVDVTELSGDRALETLLRRSVVPGMAMAIRADLIRTLTPIPDPWMHDYWWAVGAALRKGFYFDPFPCVEYRQHSSNLVGVDMRGVMRRARKAGSTPSNAYRYSRMFDALATHVRAEQTLESQLDVVEAKARFELARARLPSSLFARVTQVALLALREDGYRRYSAHGLLNAVRDIIAGTTGEGASPLPERERQ